MNLFRKSLFFVIGLFYVASIFGSVTYRTRANYVLFEKSNNSFEVVGKRVASICVDPTDWKGVRRAVSDLSQDIFRVTGKKASVLEVNDVRSGSILVGTIGNSVLIDRLIRDGKLDVSEVEGKWESFLIQTVDECLVIAGSDQRGTIFGIYDVSERIGVSPWYWWADVPTQKKDVIYIKNVLYIQDPPKVKYRGIFINDEEPSFGGWARTKFGGINSKMYAHMFELLLRLKANYLWPAMWGKSFNEDDPLNPVLANEYGVVMGTSHHEPMMRSHTEYTSRKDVVGPWDYSVNKEKLDVFFTEGLERNKDYDNMITIGMRGDGDVPMSEAGDEANMKVLANVVEGQREVIKKVFDKDPSEVPQMWAIFTEVQRYYEAGFTVPDDVLLLFCDNNWGYIRRTGPENERARKGGMGLYYHIDMNGGPWNDRWINTTTIPKLYEQFNLAYRSGLDDLWVVNVGDLKPKELPIDFILRYAWNPDAYNPGNLRDYTIDWATRQFGSAHAEEIADIVSKYSKYNLWRKPEVQATQIFSVVNHHEADRVATLWRNLARQVDDLRPKISKEAQDAFYQLVYYPAKASAGVAEIYLAAGKNNLYAKQGRLRANEYAKRARELFELDKQLTAFYNDSIANGKWKNMMSDVHIGYVQWSMPPANKLPELMDVMPLSTPCMGVAVEGSESVWPGSNTNVALPIFDALRNPTYYIDVFNKGLGSFNYQAKSNKDWIRLSNKEGAVQSEVRLNVSIDWSAAPMGRSEGVIEVNQGDSTVAIRVVAVNEAMPKSKRSYFGGLIGEFSIPANEFQANRAGKEAAWIELPDLGRGAACMGIYPVTAASAASVDAPVLEYDVLLNQKGKTTICFGILPTQDVNPARGLRFAVALNDGTPVVVDARKGLHDEFKEYNAKNLALSKVLQPLPPVNRNIALLGNRQDRRNEVFDNLRWVDVELEVFEPGIHTLKVFMVDPEVVLERIVVNPDNHHPSYFGAPVVRNMKFFKL